MVKQGYDLLMKMIFVGDFGVGKTNLITRIASDQFHEQQLATIGVDFKIVNFNVDGLNVKVQLWDSAGQQRFRSMLAPYYRGAGAVVLCYSLSDEDSLRNIQRWIEQVKKFSSQDSQMVLIGCKSDLQHQIAPDVINQMIDGKGFKHYTTSAKTGQGVYQSLQLIVTQWTRKVKQSLQILRQNKDAIKQSNKKIQDSYQPFKPKKGCC